MVKVVVFLAAAAGALNFGSKPTTGGTTPAAFKPAFGNPAAIAQRAAERLAKQEECKKDLIPTPGRFLFAFGRPDVLAARQAERCAKWEWSEEFLNKARPDKFGVGNYGAGDLYDDGLTRLERNQMVSGREGFLTGAAKLRYRRITGQIEDADASGLSAEMQYSAGKGNSYIDVENR